MRHPSATALLLDSPDRGPLADPGPMIVRPIAGGGVEVLAPAKLNLFLEVLGRRRADGYHEIESLMVTIDLLDTLTFPDDPRGGSS